MYKYKVVVAMIYMSVIMAPKQKQHGKAKEIKQPTGDPMDWLESSSQAAILKMNAKVSALITCHLLV